MSDYYVWVPCGDYNAVHAHYVTHEAAEVAVAWIYNRYRPALRVHAAISEAMPPLAKRWIIRDMPAEGNLLLEEAK